MNLIGEKTITFLNKVLLATRYAAKIKVLTQMVVKIISFDMRVYDNFFLKSYRHISYEASRSVVNLFLPNMVKSKKDFQSG